jgi:hypothetical protein
LINDDGLNATEKLNKISALLQGRKEDGLSDLKASLKVGLNQGDYCDEKPQDSVGIQPPKIPPNLR